MLQLGPEATIDAPTEAPEASRPSFDLVPGLGAREIDRELRRADRQSDVGTRRLAFYLADMEKRGICQLLGYATATVYAVRRLEMGRRHAQQLIAAGRALEDLPKIDAAFCQGSINWTRVRLLTKIAVPETEAAWLERALALGLGEFEREVLTSEKGRPPRAGRRGLPQVKIGVAAKLDRLAYEQWELAKRKLADERGEATTDADLMACAARLFLSTSKDGAVPGRARLDDSIYRIVVDRCSDCEQAYLQTAEGEAELPKATLEMIYCDAKVEIIRDVEPGRGAKLRAGEATEAKKDLAVPTPAWMRTKVLVRDGHACRVCGGVSDVQAHHVAWRSMEGRTKPSNLAGVCSRCHALIHENLLFVSGVAPHRLEITDREGNPLGRAPGTLGPELRTLRGVPAITEEPSTCVAPNPEVTFDALPRSADANWLARHVGLFQWNEKRGELTFEPGSPVEPAVVAEEPRRAPSDAGDRPESLSGVIGQQRVVEALRVAVEAARIRGRPLDHVLLLGEPGLGKTTLARAVAWEMGSRVSITSGPLIKDASVLIKALTALATGEVLFIDEIHGLPRPVAESLYEAMEDGVLRLPVTDGHRTKTIEITLNPFTLIGATTELGKVPGPLQSRFTIREHLDAYEESDVAEIVIRAVRRDGIAIDGDAALAIGRTAHGIPRDAIKLSRRVQDLALAKRVGAIDGCFLANALRAFGIDQRGLGTVERKALGALERHGRGRAMGIARWSAASGLCTAVLRQVCEPVLIRLGLIAVTPRGRMALG